MLLVKKYLAFIFLITNFSIWAQEDIQIVFKESAYKCVWKNNESNVKVIEFLKEGETMKNYTTMIRIDIISDSSLTIDSSVKFKMKQLKNLAESGYSVKNKIYRNETSQEVMIDYLISNESLDSSAYLERNVMKVIEIKDKSVVKGAMAFTFIERVTKTEVDSFIKDISENGIDLINYLGAFDLRKLLAELDS